MNDDENTPSADAATDHDAEVAPKRAARFTRRELAIGGIGVGLGIFVSVAGALIVALAISGLGSLAKFTPMTDAAKACHVESNEWLVVGDGGQSISMKSEGTESSGADMTDLACVLRKLHTPDSVISQMDSTRALDGRETASWQRYSASWGYHPDDGLNIVIEVAAN